MIHSIQYTYAVTASAGSGSPFTSTRSEREPMGSSTIALHSHSVKSNIKPRNRTLTMVYVKRFEPIESDPQILTELMHRLGVEKTFRIDDVLDYEKESREPALALIAIFPESRDDEAGKAIAEAERTPIFPTNIQFLRQTIDNSCGLIAILHCVLNTVAASSIS